MNQAQAAAASHSTDGSTLPDVAGGGERDLTRLLATMSPDRVPGEFVFTTADDPALPATIHASVVEPEGRSVVVTRADADRIGLTYDYVAGWITLTVHSSLAAVGLTAAVSAALATAGISCNVIAGRYHDHLLVPADRIDDALGILSDLSRPPGAAPRR